MSWNPGSKASKTFSSQGARCYLPCPVGNGHGMHLRPPFYTMQLFRNGRELGNKNVPHSPQELKAHRLERSLGSVPDASLVCQYPYDRTKSRAKGLTLFDQSMKIGILQKTSPEEMLWFSGAEARLNRVRGRLGLWQKRKRSEGKKARISHHILRRVE
jgi:hypothetical protein